MSLEVSAEAYSAFMGRFSVPLAREFAQQLHLVRGQTALDIGAGAGALTAVLADRLGEDRVCAVEPSGSLLAALRRRLPKVDACPARAEALPFEDDRFDVVTAQLVVHFMADPVNGLREMARVAKGGGLIAASVWDHAGGSGPLAAFWQAARMGDPDVDDESDLPGVREGHLAELCAAAGLRDVTETQLTVRVQHASFDEWWQPFTLGVGPAGAYLAGLEPPSQRALRQRCRRLLGQGPGLTTATAWTVTARVTKGWPRSTSPDEPRGVSG
jgi:SAM-dependent methyltransferase